MFGIDFPGRFYCEKESREGWRLVVYVKKKKMGNSSKIIAEMFRQKYIENLCGNKSE